MFDNGYSRAAAEYEMYLASGGDDCCEPEIIRAEKEYEPDGYSLNFIYNCEECDNTECEYWSEYNNG